MLAQRAEFLSAHPIFAAFGAGVTPGERQAIYYRIQQDAKRDSYVAGTGRDAVQVFSAVEMGPAACATCLDIRWLLNDKYQGIPCHCQAYDHGNRVVSAAIGERAAREYRFENFDLRLNPTMKKPLESAQAWAQGDGSPWFVLSGVNGCGKTHLALAAARIRATLKQQVFFQEVPRLLDLLRSGYNNDQLQPEMDDTLGRASTVEVLILDDYGMERATPWAVSTLEDILVTRYNRLMPTMITTNDLATAGERILSRISDARHCVLEICDGAQDARPSLR